MTEEKESTTNSTNLAPMEENSVQTETEAKTEEKSKEKSKEKPELKKEE